MSFWLDVMALFYGIIIAVGLVYTPWFNWPYE